MRSFVALQNFYSPGTKSEYVEGLSYTIRSGNRYLGALAEVWALEGKIRFAHTLTKCVMTGIGHICAAPPPPPPVMIWDILELTPVVQEPITMDIGEFTKQVEEAEKDEPIQTHDLTVWEKTKSAWKALWL